jgi:hypothetical protein
MRGSGGREIIRRRRQDLDLATADAAVAVGLPELAIAFPLEGKPRIVGSGGAEVDTTLVRRIILGLDDEWRELLVRAAELAARDERAPAL